MRTISIICTAVTVLQVLDVSITGISAVTPPGSPLKAASEVVDPNNNAEPNPTRKPKITTRALKPNSSGNKTPSTPSPNNAASPDSNSPGMNPDEPDSLETEPPKTIKESGKRVLKTAKSIASQRGASLLNGFTGMLKGANGAFDFFGKFLLGRSKNVKDLAKESLDMASSFSESATNGAKNIINSAKAIGDQGAKTMYNTLQKTTSFGKNLTKLGGTVMNTPISIGEDLVSSANDIAKVPSKLSRMASEGVVKPLLGYLGPNSDEGEPEKENGENPPDSESPVTPKTPPPSPQKKPVQKKP